MSAEMEDDELPHDLLHGHLATGRVNPCRRPGPFRQGVRAPGCMVLGLVQRTHSVVELVPTMVGYGRNPETLPHVHPGGTSRDVCATTR